MNEALQIIAFLLESTQQKDALIKELQKRLFKEEGIKDGTTTFEDSN